MATQHVETCATQTTELSPASWLAVARGPAHSTQTLLPFHPPLLWAQLARRLSGTKGAWLCCRTLSGASAAPHPKACQRDDTSGYDRGDVGLGGGGDDDDDDASGGGHDCMQRIRIPGLKRAENPVVWT
eukprot:1070044-Rhodomonas_salina.4